MTVCIAAICQHENQQYIVGACDKQITAGDIKFEPPGYKIWNIGVGTAALTAGDAATQNEICVRVIRSQPKSVHDAVETYSKQLGKFNVRQAERKFLYPIGLDMKSFLARQQEFSADFVEQKLHEMSRDRIDDGVETIICGLDRVGAHIYRVNRHGQADCHTAIGFATVGEGEWHASSQFMFAKYAPNTWSFSRAMLLVYSAKKRAEVTPSVGKETDIFYIGYQQGIVPIVEPIKTALEGIYEIGKKAQEDAVAQQYSTLDDYLTPAMAAGVTNSL